ncbi:MAG: hypothetical protein OEM00_10980 [Burkholderiaceae bacterium]|nr:hypothetical protein [Burkholderiaceae bacterium]
MNVAYLDMARGLDVAALISLGVLGLLGLIVGSLVKVKNNTTGQDEQSGLGGVEALVLVVVGGFLARTFIWLLLLPLNDVKSGAVVLGHFFFLIPAVIDDFIAIGGPRVLTSPEGLLFLATVIGAFTAMMDGVWRIHDWKGLGWLSFPLDMTWGLAGVNYGLLLHLVNFAWANHATETRHNGHRYQSGFRLKPTFAFTQGSVMSNLSDNPGTDLYRHEMTHVWQNRMFGPFYTLNYIGWMIFWLIPGLIAGATSKTATGASVGPGKGAERWCYFNCPWEVWGYAVQGQDRKAWGSELIWSAVPVIIAAIFVFGGITALCIVLYGLQL